MLRRNIKFIYNIPYSPEYNPEGIMGVRDHNPIEQVFSKLKRLIRQMNVVNETIKNKIMLALKKITKTNLDGFYRNSFRFLN